MILSCVAYMVIAAWQQECPLYRSSSNVLIGMVHSCSGCMVRLSNKSPKPGGFIHTA